MTGTPRLSVGLAVYNGEPFLAETLESLLGQSYEDFELVISDNDSTDGTAEICRRYGKRDARIRYFRQSGNIGAAPNHNFVFRQSRGELFKWASADDLYARDLLRLCVDALDELPRVVLAHSWTAMIDGSGTVTEGVEYPLATGSLRAPERFRSTLEGGRGADDYGGVIRADVLRRTPLLGSHHFADRTLFAELALRGPFYHVPDWLHFRRDHPEAAYRRCQTVRARCANLDPRRASRLRHPPARLYAEFGWGYVAAIRRAPMSQADRRECYRHLARWLAGRALPAAGRVVRGGTMPVEEPLGSPPPVISIDRVVAGRQTSTS